MSAKRFALNALMGAILLMSCSLEIRSTSSLPPTETSTPDSTTWDYVTLGDSFLAMSSIPQQFAAFIEEDKGVKVTLHEKAILGQDPDRLLANLQGNEELRQLVREAEVISFDFSPGWADEAESKYLAETCGGEDNQQCLRDALETAKADWMGIAILLGELTSGRPVLVSTFVFGDWIYDGYYKSRITPEEKTVMSSYLHEFQAYQDQDAVARGMFVHRVFPPSTADPLPSDYFQSDGMHLSREGSAVISGLLREAGYERKPLSICPTGPTPFILPSPSVPLETIAGTYATTLTTDDLRKTGASITPSYDLAGKWKMELTVDGVVRLWKGNIEDYGLWSEGTYSLTGDALLFGPDKGPGACSQERITHGSYAWSLVDGILTLTMLDEPCNRKYVMTALPWTSLP